VIVGGTAPLAPELVELLEPEPVVDEELDVVVVLEVFSVL
jgi:hypothetical protein